LVAELPLIVPLNAPALMLVFIFIFQLLLNTM
jgi:hypothetical protein